MYIKQLEIDNFKSFARKVEIPLLEGFTTISGPNGSGKSNIIDSILFALGLATTRNLRAEKIAHLISTYTNKNEAMVKVTFSGTPDGVDFSVARRLKKASNGQFLSTYFINDNVSTLTDVHSLLEKYNITPNSYNVIMQLDVMSITNCTSGERRKIIDEIAGVADFDRRIEQANKELDTVESRVEKTNFILNEVDGRLQQLEEEKEVALKYQKIKEEKVQLESKINAVRFFDIKRNLENAHVNILEFGKKKKETEIELSDTTEKLKLIKEKYEQLAKEVKEKGEDKQLELKRNAEELKGSISRKETAIIYAEKQIQDGLKAIEGKKNGIENSKLQIKDTKLKIDLKNDEIKIIENDIKNKQNELTAILREMTGLNETADQYIEKRNNLRLKKEQLQDSATKLLQEKLPLESELSNLKEKINQSKQLLEVLQKFKSEFVEEKDKKELEIKNLEKEIEDLKIVQTKLKNDEERNKNDIEDINFQAQTIYQKISKLSAQKEIQQASGNYAVEYVMNSNIQGVHAPIVKLGSVDKEYALALETAIGARMEHIVVEDEFVASRAIEVLKSSGAGRATFVPLTKIRKAPNGLPLPKEKGVIDYAINLIDFDDIYIDAFYYAVGDTLVVEDESVARKLMGKYRLVTLTGEIYEKVGSITGGKARHKGPKFGQNDDNELEKLKNKYKELQESYKQAVQEKSNIESKLFKVRNDYSETITALSEAKAEYKRFIADGESSESKIKENTDFINSQMPRIEQINKQLDKLEQKDIELNDAILNIQAEIDDVEKLMDNDTLKDMKEKTSLVEEDIKRLTKNKMSVENDIINLERDISFRESIINSRVDEISIITKNNEKFNKDNEIAKEEIKVIQVQLNELEEKINEITAKLKVLLDERDKLNEEVLEIEKQKRFKEDDVLKIAEQIESFKARRRELEPQLEQAKQDLINAGVEVDKLEPSEISIEDLTSKIQKLQKKIDELGDVNMRAIQDYERVLARQTEMKEQIETLSKERKEILERMQGYEQLKKEAFMKTYNKLNVHFKEAFLELAGGEGTLILENQDSPFEGGLTIDAQPRDKKRQRLESMSGGEKSITALAFVFAIQNYLPAPFYAFDEVDQSLDGINVEKLANLIQTQSKNTQFIVVSHRKPMIESANRTIGVTQKEKGITKVTGVKLRD
ncbi:chromosome segregation protein SMC [bacterium]|nr:chromosome segregation protein SMC [bacterium]